MNSIFNLSILLLALFTLHSHAADDSSCQDRPVDQPYFYTFAKKFANKEEYSYEELSLFWRRIDRDKVGLVRLPTANIGSTIGLCGTYHYNPDHLALTPKQFEDYKAGKYHGSGIQNNQEVGSYLTEIAACRLVDVFQEWTKECETFNLDKNICAIQWGDASHRDTKKFNPHSVKYHGFGSCIDIRPIKKGSLEEFTAEHADDPELPLFLKRKENYRDWIVSTTDTYYDREKTMKLIEILKAKGADTIFFQDLEMQKDKGWKKSPTFKPMKGHANHIHVCFPDNSNNREACEKFVYKRSVCGALLY